MEASLQTPTSSSEAPVEQNSPVLPTFMDHVHELRGRLFWIAVVFILATIAAYPFYDAIISLLVAPLKGQQLYYLTPIGGFSFIIKICTYVGAVATLPAIMYHLYRYLQPAVGKVNGKVLLSYVVFSALLAFMGISFAYYVSLPASLYFLTGLNIGGVTAMLTVDSYYSFVMAYMIGAALLFQLPLLLLIINSITPLKPSKLMGYQRHVILAAFIVAAIISPTPDMVNQALLAVPVILMYQVGIILVWLRNLLKREGKKTAKQYTSTTYQPAPAVADSTLLGGNDDQYAWIDDLFTEEEDGHRQVVAHVKSEEPAVIAPQPIVNQAPVPEVEPRKKLTPTRGYAMDLTGQPRSVPRSSTRPLPKVARTYTAPAPAGDSQSSSPMQRAMPVRPAGPVRYIDGVSVPVSNII